MQYEEERRAYKILVGKHNRNDHLEDLDVDGRILLEIILEKQSRKAWIGLIWLMTGQWRDLVNTIKNLWFPQNTTSYATISFSRTLFHGVTKLQEV
jgi:hypothetical protein